MSTEQHEETVVEEVADTVDQATEAVDSHEPAAEENNEIETRARSMGWVPQEEYRGDPKNWRGAEEFVRRGEEELPILRERTRTMSRKIDEMDRSHKQSLDRLERMNTLALQRQREQLTAAYDEAMRNAVEMGDVQRYDQLNQDRHQAITAYDQQINTVNGNGQHQQPAQQPQQPQSRMSEADRKTVEAWGESNSWYMADREMHDVANRFHERMLKEKPGMSLEENLRETRAYVQRRYPEKFGTTQKAPNAVEGGARVSSGRAKGVNELSPEAKKQGARFVEEGLFKSLADYAKAYHAQEAAS